MYALSELQDRPEGPVSTSVMEPPDRRQFGRVTPVERIRGTAGSIVVYVIDLSLTGIRVAHQAPLPPVGEKLTVSFEWQGGRASIQCEVRRTRLEKAPRSKFEKPLYHTGLMVVAKDPASDRTMRDLIESCVLRALDEQRANAMGIPPVAAQSFQTGKGEEFRRCELHGGEWLQSITRDPQQPEGEGFTVSSSEMPSKVELLCRAYERGSEDSRRLIRTFAALSISKSEGIPTRRYMP